MNYEPLIQSARHIRDQALAIYSQFPVGAALLTQDGTIYTGINIESSSYGLTCCAERVALFKALSEGERKFSAIAVAVSGGELCPPCGACRQVLWDYTEDIDVILVADTPDVQQLKLSQLFPYAFDKGFLEHE